MTFESRYSSTNTPFRDDLEHLFTTHLQLRSFHNSFLRISKQQLFPIFKIVPKTWNWNRLNMKESFFSKFVFIFLFSRKSGHLSLKSVKVREFHDTGSRRLDTNFLLFLGRLCVGYANFPLSLRESKGLLRGRAWLKRLLARVHSDLRRVYVIS